MDCNRSFDAFSVFVEHMGPDVASPAQRDRAVKAGMPGCADALFVPLTM